MSIRDPGLELKGACLEYLADNRFHQSFILPPSKVTNRQTWTKVTYCDVGCRVKSDGSINKAAILFCGGMFAGRWLGSLLDVAAQKLGVRLLSVDRPGLGGTPAVDLEHRVQTWLEIVPALLKHLRLRHVALVCHSAGTIYLFNTVLHLRSILHPKRPYIGIVAPWIHHSDTSSPLISLLNIAPQSCIGNFHHLTRFMLTTVMPSVGPMFTFSGSVAAKIGSSLPSATRQPDATTLVMQPGTATADEVSLERETITELRIKYVTAEDISGGSQEALLCLKRPRNYWGFWSNFDTAAQVVADNERYRCRRRGPHSRRENLRVEVFYAQNDRLTNGKKGATWFDNCWREDIRQGVIDFYSEIVPGQNHESILDPDLIGGPIEKIFLSVAKHFRSKK